MTGTSKRRTVYALLSAKERKHLREDGGCKNIPQIKSTLRAVLEARAAWTNGPFKGCHDCLSIAQRVSDAGFL